MPRLRRARRHATSVDHKMSILDTYSDKHAGRTGSSHAAARRYPHRPLSAATPSFAGARAGLLCPAHRMTVSGSPAVLWRPSPHDIDNANATRFMSWLDHRLGSHHPDWNDLWEWSVRDLRAFWSAVWEYYGVAATRRPDHIVSDDAMPNTRGLLEFLELARPPNVSDRASGPAVRGVQGCGSTRLVRRR